ncbi:hypothetical protein FCJ61_25210 [Burkholderia metallica]|uniref:IS1096 element passenger TnpR family protein n=1 Tax=Burkholderia metallica TaxID=488729 RepID=UPI001C2D914D|nr:hypothetical protein [Burkholderia metallica]
MSAPAEQLTLPPPRTYTRSDFAALRAWVQRVPLPTIATRYYDPDTTPYEDAPAALERHLKAMRDDLVHLALLNGSSALAEHLKTSIRQHGRARLTAVSLKMVEAAAKLAAAAPAPTHAVGLWFRPPIARRLAGEGIATLGDLIAFCNRRGGRWWRRVPRIGAGRARVLVAWLRTHADSLGATIAADVDTTEPLGTAAPADAIALVPADGGRMLAPLERLAVPHALSGAAGTNRAPGLCYLHASHDLDALRAYLARYADQPATLRAYTRELERLLLWAITVRGTALSSLTVEDGDAYKAFLRAPSDAFVGPPASRASGRWRPFAPGGLSLDSQRYAIRAIRGAFDWLVDVRYLAGNPWRAVRDPRPVQRVSRMQIDRALPATLWDKVRTTLDAHCEGYGPNAPRWRTARALLLLMGDSGLRIAEAVAATRDQLQQLPADGELPASWQLTVVGKGSKARVTPVSDACAAAIAAHWRDRGADFRAGAEPNGKASRALVAPLAMPATPNANAKAARLAAGDPDEIGGYAVRPARGLVAWALAQLRESLPDLSEAERQQLARTSPHALRHTFGTQTVAAGVPLDVAQRVLGHASLQTTTVYVTAEQRRIRAELGRYFGKGRAGAAPIATEAPAAPAMQTPRPVATPTAEPNILATQQDSVIGKPFWSLDVPDSVPNDDEQIAHVRVTLQVQASEVRRTERARDALERWILAFAGTERVAPGVVMLLLPYRQVLEVDTHVHAWLDDIAAEAQEGGFVCALDARWGERRWTHTGDLDDRSTRRAIDDDVPATVLLKPDASPRIWRVRISLLGFRPEIWRRLEIPADIDLAELHVIAQAAMGWANMHRYGFALYGFLDRIDLDGDHASGVRLLDVTQPGDTLGYTYDIGDYWHHAIEIEAEISPAMRTAYPRCTAGRNACPPEDCGGPSGYAHLLRTLAGRMTGEKRELLDWLGGRFDPHAFRVADVNQRLANRHSKWE